MALEQMEGFELAGRTVRSMTAPDFALADDGDVASREYSA